MLKFEKLIIKFLMVSSLSRYHSPAFLKTATAPCMKVEMPFNMGKTYPLFSSLGINSAPFLIESLSKCQQLVPVIFILFLPCFDFGGKAGGKVGAEGVEAVENGNNFFLLLIRR